jgi:SAM-dependent methyltransferase
MSERSFPNWRELYRDQPVENMPWYYPELDPDLARALDAQALTSGRALDLGTGPGTQAFALAQRGFEVTASDLSAHAVERAQSEGAARGLAIRFVQDDILATGLEAGFDLVFDRGCFHVFPPEQRPHYAQTVSSLVKPGGLFFLKCFSDEQPGEQGPYRLSPNDIADSFRGAFELLSIDRTIYQGTLEVPPRALFCTLRKG